MEYVFVTQKTDNGGTARTGKRIHAQSWDETRKKAQQIGVKLLGILIEERTIYNYALPSRSARA
jgi:hypothetical protein